MDGHEKCREILLNPVSNFEWRHPIHEGNTEAMITLKNFSVINVPADFLSPLGAGSSAGMVMKKCGSCMYKGMAL